MSISLKRLPSRSASPCGHSRSSYNLIIVVIAGFSRKQSFLENETKQKDISNMFATLFLAGKMPLVAELEQKRNPSKVEADGVQTQLSSSHLGFQVKEADGSKWLLYRTANLLELRPGTWSLGRRSQLELGEAVPNATNSGTDLNLESSSTSFYPDENHYPLVYFWKESWSPPGARRIET